MYLILTESASQEVAKPYFYQYLIARNVTLSWVDDVADPEKLKARLEKEYRRNSGEKDRCGSGTSVGIMRNLLGLHRLPYRKMVI